MWGKNKLTYMSDTRHPLRKIVKGSIDVEESYVETMQ